MGKINWGRVVLGGLVAGVIIDMFEGALNGVILEKQWATVMVGLGKSGAMSIKQILAFNVWGLAAGILMIWLYAAIRPRYGAGPRTAMCAGIAVWALAYALATAVPVFFHIYPVGLASIGVAVAIVECLVAACAGAALYKEDAVTAPRSVGARA